MTPTLLLAATLLLPRHVQEAPPPSADEIVVIGERMRRLKLSTKTDRKTGAPICVFRRRSGDPAFDAMMCEAVLTCAKTVKTVPQMETCVGPTVQAYARDLTARRRSAPTP
ncbi:hypothetical protein TPR58_20890 [Sphingomonas sp. HF-S3]|uniref:UrcA family protein n=1 Tax=Sphingomonas rustica TaxID=3103142 RepID=A0ABV0BDM2_9SPHN